MTLRKEVLVFVNYVQSWSISVGKIYFVSSTPQSSHCMLLSTLTLGHYYQLSPTHGDKDSATALGKLTTEQNHVKCLIYIRNTNCNWRNKTQ